jgi:DNA-binding NtrC family response regulator
MFLGSFICGWNEAMFPESVILVVGDETDETESIASMLADRCRVIGVETPEDALTHASDDVDLVISQLDAPEFSGLSLLRMWKARDPQTPFLFITLGNDISTVVEGMKLGADDCLVKPVDPNELRAAVSKILVQDRSGADRAESNSEYSDDQKTGIEIPPGTSLEDLERAAVEQALAQHHGNRTHAAKTLGISVRTLQRKLKAWGMPVLASYQPSNSSRANLLYTEQHSPPFTSTPYSSHLLH